jgi:hypothetical protein
MIVSWLILALSLAMVFFYFQATCQRILRRQFDQEYFRSIANVIRLEFPSLREALDQVQRLARLFPAAQGTEMRFPRPDPPAQEHRGCETGLFQGATAPDALFPRAVPFPGGTVVY